MRRGRVGPAESGMGPPGILADPPVSKVGPPADMVRAHLPANPLFSVSGREPRAGCFGIRCPAAGCFEARFAPPSPLTLAAPSRGANSSHKFRAAARGRPLFQGAVCSPLPANPYSSVPGSKFFTQIPRHRLPPAAFSEARFAPLPPLILAASFRGANSSHKFRPAGPYPSVQSTHRPAPPHKKAPCRFIGKVLPSLQQPPPAVPSPAGHF